LDRLLYEHIAQAASSVLRFVLARVGKLKTPPGRSFLFFFFSAVLVKE
jgi:hypothetical protein